MPKVNDSGVIREMTSEELKVRDDLDKIDAAEKIEYAKVKYKDDRRSLYPEIGDQLDDLYKKGAFSADMTAKIKKVKGDNPKPS